MIIFIDESGLFANPQNRANLVSFVGALVIPESEIDEIFSKFKTFKKRWGFETSEIKGSQLNEDQVAEIAKMLSKHEVILKVVGIDLGVHTQDEIRQHHNGQVSKIREAVRPGSKSKLDTQLAELANSMEQLSLPLYIQATLMTLLVDDVLKIATLFYSQRIPTCLGNFIWIIDAKEKIRTRYESVWSEVCRPFMQTFSMREPLLQMREADYSALQKYSGQSPSPPDHLAKHIPREETDPFLFLDLNLIFEHLKFIDSRNELGLQLVDILVTSVRRAFSKTLQPTGWESIGMLMVHAQKGKNTVRLISLGPQDSANVPYKKTLFHFDKTAKAMIL